MNKDITSEQLREVLRYEPDTGRFFWLKKLGPRAMPGNEAGSLNQTGYVKIKVFGVQYVRSRLAWLYVYGEWPDQFIDHVNRDRTDDRICNLRTATQGQNNRNTKIRSDNTSGIKGVCHYHGKFMARINFRGRSIYLGLHDSIDNAKNAVKKASIQYHGEYSSHD